MILVTFQIDCHYLTEDFPVFSWLFLAIEPSPDTRKFLCLKKTKSTIAERSRKKKVAPRSKQIIIKLGLMIKGNPFLECLRVGINIASTAEVEKRVFNKKQ